MLASGGADALAALNPVFGEHRLQVAADRFVDRACAALSAIAVAARATPSDDGHLRTLGDHGRGIPDRRARW